MSTKAHDPLHINPMGRRWWRFIAKCGHHQAQRRSLYRCNEVGHALVMPYYSVRGTKKVIPSSISVSLNDDDSHGHHLSGCARHAAPRVSRQNFSGELNWRARRLARARARAVLCTSHASSKRLHG